MFEFKEVERNSDAVRMLLILRPFSLSHLSRKKERFSYRLIRWPRPSSGTSIYRVHSIFVDSRNSKLLYLWFSTSSSLLLLHFFFFFFFFSTFHSSLSFLTTHRHTPLSDASVVRSMENENGLSLEIYFPEYFYVPTIDYYLFKLICNITR